MNYGHIPSIVLKWVNDLVRSIIFEVICMDLRMSDWYQSLLYEITPQR
jgi:hypothetical protein